MECFGVLVGIVLYKVSTSWRLKAYLMLRLSNSYTFAAFCSVLDQTEQYLKEIKLNICSFLPHLTGYQTFLFLFTQNSSLSDYVHQIPCTHIKTAYNCFPSYKSSGTLTNNKNTTAEPLNSEHIYFIS